VRRAKQHDVGGLTFFIDECIKCSLIVDALNQLATKRERVHVAPRGTLDEDWLRDAGIAGWVCFSRDRRMLIRPNELNAILYADALPLVRRAARDLKRAFVARIEPNADLSLLLERGKWLPHARRMRRLKSER
jgi:hypothetical protein